MRPADWVLENKVTYAAGVDEGEVDLAGYNHLLLVIPYRFGGRTLRYIPDFVVDLNQGRHLLLESKGREDAKAKAKHSAAQRWAAAPVGSSRGVLQTRGASGTQEARCGALIRHDRAHTRLPAIERGAGWVAARAGHLLASAGKDLTARSCEAASGAEARTLTVHADRVNRVMSVAFSPDGRLLAFGASRTDDAVVG